MVVMRVVPRADEMMVLENLKMVEETNTSVMGAGLQWQGRGMEGTVRVEVVVG